MKLKPKMDSRGQALVEFALILPILLLLVLGAIDISNMIYTYHRMVAAAREGTRIGAESTLPTAEMPQMGANRARRVLADSGIPHWAESPLPFILSHYFLDMNDFHINLNDDPPNIQGAIIFMTRIRHKPEYFLGGLLENLLGIDPTLYVSVTTYAYSQRCQWNESGVWTCGRT
ncbi:MAG: pilus assembly protein [Candidatus Omnitrophica bacterium]|nr:pilus assembly protein [Candidatus Omnitrophota bacterium]